MRQKWPKSTPPKSRKNQAQVKIRGADPGELEHHFTTEAVAASEEGLLFDGHPGRASREDLDRRAEHGVELSEGGQGRCSQPT